MGMTASQVQQKFPSVSSFGTMLNQAYNSKTIPGYSAPGPDASSQWEYFYTQFVNSHPNATLGTAEQTFLETIALGSAVQAAISKAPTAAASATGQIAKGTQQGLDQTGQTFSSALDFLDGIASAALWERVAMVVGGGVLIILALGSMTGGGPKIVKTAVKAAPFL